MTPSGTPSSEPVLYPDFEPEDVRYIGDVETLRAISDATRMRILETMVQRRSPAWSVKELAAALDMPPTRLYHHVELLLERDLIRATERRVVSGIIETRYSAAALSFQLDRALFAGDTAAGLEVLHQTLASVFDTARAEIELAIRLHVVETGPDAPDDRRILLTRGLTRLTPARTLEFRTRLQALTDEYGDDPANEPDATAIGFVVAVYPMPPTSGSTDPQEPSDD
ncbi:MAG TPA: helix-turn-helix domain-containing protein [Candidatus Limnocylindrales bacterium]|nr:helix-turn-helix domain-containing protein [Candidatus Limnocylindrales bacterium]